MNLLIRGYSEPYGSVEECTLIPHLGLASAVGPVL